MSMTMHGVFIAKTNLNIEPQTIFTEVVTRTFILVPQWKSYQRLQRHKKTSTGLNFAQWLGTDEYLSC